MAYAQVKFLKAKRELLFVSCLLFFLPVCLSQTKTLSLKETIELAKNQSPSAAVARTKFKNSYWEYRIYRSGYFPKLGFSATLPSSSRTIQKITLPSGDFFYERNIESMEGAMNLSQSIPLTGGNIFMSSSLERVRILGTFPDTFFLASPVTVGLTQPLFTFNPFRWQSKIEPLKYKEAKKRYVEDMEEVSIQATNIFFDLLTARAALETASLNQTTNDTLYKISFGRYNLGKIAENELLQMELNLLNANNALAKARLDVEVKTAQLKSFLSLKDERIELRSDMNISFFTVDLQKAQSEAMSNRPAVIAFEREIIEARRDLAKARYENRFSVNVFGSYGLTQTGPIVEDAYQDPLDKQQFTVGLQVPILDWGSSRARVKMAQANQELVNINVEKGRNDFEQEIFLKVMQFNMQKDQLLIAAKADTIAAKRYEVSKQRYLIGKIDIETLSIAQAEKDAARKAFFEALRTYWLNYYETRKITLYDFEKSMPIDVSPENLVR